MDYRKPLSEQRRALNSREHGRRDGGYAERDRNPLYSRDQDRNRRARDDPYSSRDSQYHRQDERRDRERDLNRGRDGRSRSRSRSRDRFRDPHRDRDRNRERPHENHGPPPSSMLPPSSRSGTVSQEELAMAREIIAKAERQLESHPAAAPPRYDDHRPRDNKDDHRDNRGDDRGNNRDDRGDYSDNRREQDNRRDSDGERRSRFTNNLPKISGDIPEHERRRMQDERVFPNDRRNSGLRPGEWVCKICGMLILSYKGSDTPKPKCARCDVKSLNPWFKPGDWCCPLCNFHNKAGNSDKCGRTVCTYVFDNADVKVGICK